MNAACWLAWRELIIRPRSFWMAATAMAIAVAVCATTELTYRAREVGVSAEIDAMGPSLLILPAQRTSRDLVRFELGDATLPADTLSSLLEEFAPWIRAAEQRLLLQQTLRDVSTPVIGIDPASKVASSPGLRGLRSDQVALGAELALRLGLQAGDQLRLADDVYEVAEVLPTSASVEDMALVLTRTELGRRSGQEGAVNEIRLYTLPGRDRGDLARRIRSLRTDIAVIIPDNNDSVRLDVERGLSKVRYILYGVTALIAGFCVMVWSSLNAHERQTELATLVAIGGSARTVSTTLALRAAIVAIVGALLGNLIAAAIVLVQDFESARHVVGAWRLLLGWPAAAALLALVGTLPVTLSAAAREHVKSLQG